MLTDSWIKHTWEFISTNKIKFHGTYSIPQKAAKHDWALMDAIVDAPSDLFSKAEVININRCRLYKKCFFASDICCSDGVTIHPEVYSHLPLSDRNPTMHYPFQGPPSSIAWAAWTKAVHYCWSKGPTAITKLHKIIGPWFRSSAECWSSRVSSSLDEVFIKNGSSWECYAKTHSSRGHSVYHSHSQVSQIPHDTKGITILCHIGSSVIHTSAPMTYIADEMEFEYEQDEVIDTSQVNLLHFVDTRGLDTNTALMLKYCSIPHYNGLIQALTASSVTIVTDGSYHPTLKVATAAFKIEDLSGKTLAYGYSRVPGNREMLDAYRAEAWGIYLCLTFLDYVHKKHNIEGNEVLILCDCKGALVTGFEHDLPATGKAQHYDILQELFLLKQHITFTAKHQWVKGHQGQQNTSQTARMNREVDSLAKSFLAYCYTKPRTQASLHPGPHHWYAEVDGTRIVKSFTNTIIDKFHKKELHKYICDSSPNGVDIIRRTDWEAIELASHSYTCNEKLWSTKLACKFVPVGQNMSRWGLWNHPRCRRCGHAMEDIHHLFSCPAIRAVSDRGKAMTSLLEWMQSVHTSPFIMMTLKDTLMALTGTSFSQQCPALSHPLILDAAADQDILGFQNLLSGRVSNKWRIAQQHYLDIAYPETKLTGRTWASGLVRNLCSFSKLIWVKRSEEIHESDSDLWKTNKEAELKASIKRIFAMGISSVACDERFLFDINLTTLLNLPITAKQQWIDATIAAQDFYERRTQPEIEIMQRFMERWRTRHR